MGKVITFANQKGGTGKTTCAFNLGVALSRTGKKVLFVDMDPQGNLSTLAKVTDEEYETHNVKNLLYAVINADKLPAPEEAVVSKENFGIIPANDELYAVEIALQSAIGSEATLLDALEEIKKNYDFVVIDSNPYIGCLTLNAVSAADGVIIPVSPALFSASGLKLLLSLIIKIKKRINKELSIYGVLFTQTNSSETATKEIVPAIKTAFDGIGIFKMQIPKTQAIANANNNRCSVFSAEGKKAAEAREAFEQLAKSVIKKGKENA